MTLSGPLIWAERVLGPIVFPVRGLNRWVSRLANPRGESVLATHEELKVLISLNRESGGLEETQARMLLRTLRLADLEVREVMTPRTEIVSITDEMTVADFLEFNARQFYSRFPVIRQGTEDVIGILAARDVLRALAAGDVSQSDPVTELATEAHFVWESKPVVDTIEEIRGGDHDMAIVVDEFGAMEGLVTLHQLLTEVVGGRRRPAATSASPGSSEILVKGSARVFDVNESLGIGLPDGEYDTVGGFVISRLDRLPKTGEKVTHGDWVLEVGKMAGPRVVEVRLCRLRTASREASPREVSPREASEPPSPTGAAR
jgi:putative hemolysin